MDKTNLTRRKELAVELLSELKNIYDQLESASIEVKKTSGTFYEEAFKEKKEELHSVMDNYHKNVDRVREINNEITASINSWYEFIKDENRTGRITFPITYYFKKRSLNKKIVCLNKEISSITINNRFIKENLTMLEHQLEIKAASLAKSGGNYLEFERILLKQKLIETELKYLIPTIPALCPADISSKGIDKLLTKVCQSQV